MPSPANTYATGYCTNVHAGRTLDETRANLERHALAVKERYSPAGPMGVGLWLSAAAADELIAKHEVERFGQWLAERGLVPYTLNGFPYGDFHQEVVKHRVYEPTWWQPERLHYTMQLVEIQDTILPKGLEGSISTLPIAWGTPCPDRGELEAAAGQLLQAAQWLHKLHEEEGRLIYLCLEPEPGCVFSFADDLVHFLEWQLLRGPDAEIVRQHIRVCHDVCHAAVMFEDQEDVFKKYAAAGIGVGKIQVSAALRMDLDLFEPPAAAPRAQAIKQLAQFAEDRYLHQTVVQRDGDNIFYEDLKLALEAETNEPRGQWRVHFHVPIYLQEFGRLCSTQEQIVQCLAAARKHTTCQHYEVETYAWGVLPAELKQPDLAAGIAEELAWFDKLSKRKVAPWKRDEFGRGART
ncbi:MAG TPA: metabolite traffic protein EboE [Pirellulaceae bacterium]|nr:metabolite traffic protein EboE [Pirellulaceae bacterium]